MLEPRELIPSRLDLDEKDPRDKGMGSAAIDLRVIEDEGGGGLDP